MYSQEYVQKQIAKAEAKGDFEAVWFWKDELAIMRGEELPYGPEYFEDL